MCREKMIMFHVDNVLAVPRTVIIQREVKEMPMIEYRPQENE